MSPNHRRIIKYPLPVHPHQALSPPPPAGTRLVAARTLCLGADRPARARQPPTHIRLGHVPRLLALPARHHTVLFARKQSIWWSARTGARGVDTERRRARAFLHLLAHSRGLVDVVERGELDHDGCRRGRHQLSGLYHCLFSLLSPLAHVWFVPSRYTS